MAEEIKKFFGRGRLLPIAVAATGVGAGMIYLKNREKSPVVVDESQSNVQDSKLPSPWKNQALDLPSEVPKPKILDDLNSKMEALNSKMEDLNSKMLSYMDSWAKPEQTPWAKPEIRKPADKEIIENPEENPKKKD